MKTKYNITLILLLIVQFGQCQTMKVNKKPSKKVDQTVNLEEWPKGTYVLSPIKYIDGKALPTPTCDPKYYEVILPKDLPSCGGGTRTQDYKVCVPKGGSADLPTDNAKPLEKEIPLAQDTRPTGYLLDTIPRNNVEIHGDRNVGFNNLTVGSGGNSTIITGDQINIYVNQTGCCCGNEVLAAPIDSNKIKLGLVAEYALNFLLNAGYYHPINGSSNNSFGIGLQTFPRKNIKLQAMVRYHPKPQFSVPLAKDTCNCFEGEKFGAFSLSARVQYILPLGKTGLSLNPGLSIDQVLAKSSTPLDESDQKLWEVPNWFSASLYLEYATQKKGSGMYARAGLTFDINDQLFRSEFTVGVFLY